ncbi:MAG: class I SAM-dependent methyltransferase [Alphaproteobacteria bacterium]|nr:class I SAM-dependent methyltransferase [Alphaproteobacteria bacterium]
MSNKNLTDDPKDHIAQIKERWEFQYAKEEAAGGLAWGKKSSETARLLGAFLGPADPGEEIVDVGAGYGRDTHAFTKLGYHVHAVDLASNAFERAPTEVKKLVEDGKATFHIGNFSELSKTIFREGQFKGLNCHRVAHLFPTESLVDDFAEAVAWGVADDGKVCISARDKRDYNPDQMEWIDEEKGLARYNDTMEGRKGHIISFWSAKRFEDKFGGKDSDFQIVHCVESEEPESVTNDVATKFTIMHAIRKARAQVQDNSNPQKGPSNIIPLPTGSQAFAGTQLRFPYAAFKFA